MSSSYLIRLGRVKGGNGVLNALKHNKRAIYAERGSLAHINSDRSALNYSLVDSRLPEEIAREAKILMLSAEIDRPRSNQVMAVEIIFSLPTERHKQDTSQFFFDCFKWVKSTFLGTLLSFDVHLDESAPHAHALILPLIEGKMQGNAMIGGKGNLTRINNLFHSGVAHQYGLSKLRTERISASDKEKLVKSILDALSNDPVRKSAVWNLVREDIQKNSPLYAQHLSIDIVGMASPKKTKSFADIMTSEGRGNA